MRELLEQGFEVAVVSHAPEVAVLGPSFRERAMKEAVWLIYSP